MLVGAVLTFDALLLMAWYTNPEVPTICAIGFALPFNALYLTLLQASRERPKFDDQGRDPEAND